MPGEQNAGLTVAQLYDVYELQLRRFAISLCHDGDQADDLVQETLIQAMGNLILLEQLFEYQRKAWLYQVLKNRFIDQQRSRQRRATLVERLYQFELLEGAFSSEFSGASLFEQVPERYRNVLEMRYRDGLTSDIIGRQLGVPSATIRSRIRLALDWMRAHLDELSLPEERSIL